MNKKLALHIAKSLRTINKKADFDNQTVQTEDIPKEVIDSIRRIQASISHEILDETQDD